MATSAPQPPAPASAAANPQGNGVLMSDPAITYAQPSAAPAVGAAPPASLYVGELDPAVTEAMLFEMFNLIGPVASIRVCRDAVTRRSLGYGYVNYHNRDDGEKALENLNYAELKGRPIRIMWSQRDPSLRRSGTGNIFIKNLTPDIDNKALYDTFSAFGTILSAKVAADDSGSKGYGFVHFVDQEAAEAAIEAVNGMLLNDQQVFVGFHVSKKERIQKMEEFKNQFTNIYVKNLDESVTDQELNDLFAKFGTILSAVVSKDEEGKSKGFGFVNFENHQEAKKAVDELDNQDFKGKTLTVCRAQKKSEREEELRQQFEKIREEKLSKFQGVNLYVKNLDESVDDETLRQEFSQCGAITSSKVMRDDKTGVSKGFGFVCFTLPEEATKAVTEMNGRMIANKPVYVALAQRKEVRRQMLAAQMLQRNQMRMQPPMPMPGAPMYYPPVAQAGRPGMFFQQPMVPRPRFNQQQIIQQFGAVPVNQRPVGRPSRGRGNFKYTSNARNAPAETKLNPSDLANQSEAQQKRMLGEVLFPMIKAINAPLAGKVTGMLLEMDHAELLHLLESPDALKSKVDEAVDALEEHQRLMQKE